MDGDGTHAVAKPELVHEMPEGTTFAARESAGQSARGVLRRALQERRFDLNPVVAGIAVVPEVREI